MDRRPALALTACLGALVSCAPPTLEGSDCGEFKTRRGVERKLAEARDRGFQSGVSGVDPAMLSATPLTDSGAEGVTGAPCESYVALPEATREALQQAYRDGVEAGFQGGFCTRERFFLSPVDRRLEKCAVQYPETRGFAKALLDRFGRIDPLFDELAEARAAGARIEARSVALAAEAADPDNPDRSAAAKAALASREARAAVEARIKGLTEDLEAAQRDETARCESEAPDGIARYCAAFFSVPSEDRRRS